MFMRIRKVLDAKELKVPGSITFLLMVLIAYSSASAQQINLNVKNAPIEQVLKIIKSQTKYTFVYKEGLFSKAGKVTLNMPDANINQILDKVFEGKPYPYEIIENVVVLKQRPASPGETNNGPAAKPPFKDSLISGRVMDKTGLLIVGVTVTNTPRGTHKKILTSSQSNGTFEIKGQKGDQLIFTSIAYKKLEITYGGEDFLNITMDADSVILNEVQVSNMDLSRKKIPWTDTIDMTHRRYQNLGQVLQGTIPGLSLQNVSQSQQALKTINMGGGAVNGSLVPTVEDLRANYNQYQSAFVANGYPTFDDYLNYLKKLGYITFNYSTSVNNNGLVPQLRGVSGFNGNTTGMLIVIDGFSQDGFPADYPMTNIESVKVIKDPEELIKWGPKAAGGIVLITSKRATAGKLQVNYNSNFYYSAAPRFNRNKQRLASSADILDYLKDAGDSGFLALGYSGYPILTLNFSPAERLLEGLQSGSITLDAFNRQWDSLGRLSNESQSRLLQQNVFNQNQMLAVSGGSNAWRFRASGSYNTSRSTALSSKNRNIGLNLNNDFLLFNKKLRAQWQIIASQSKDRSGYTFDPNAIQPYQLLVDPQGGYVYDYFAIPQNVNAFMESKGYKNYAVNSLEDARVNSNITKTWNAQSWVNMDWNLLPGLKWSGSFQYELTNSNADMLQDAASSQARQLADNYGSPVLDADGNFSEGINFHIPLGGILKKSSSSSRNWNLRSALLFNKDFGKNHLSLSLGGGGFNNTNRLPSYSTIYGYNSQTGKGQPILLPSPDPTAGILNFASIPLPTAIAANGWPGQQTYYPYTLTTPNAGNTSISRGLNWNGTAKYSYDNTYIISGKYNSIFNPNFGFQPFYTSLINYSGDATWWLNKKPFFNVPVWVSDIGLSAGVDGVKIPNLPTQIGATRTLQTDWNNYGIWVGSYNTAQQAGQSIYNIYQKLTLGIADGRYMIDISYNTLNTDSTDNGVKIPGNHRTKSFIGVNARIKLRKGLLYFNAGYGRSPEGLPQTNIRAVYDIAKESYFKSKTISSLSTDFSLQNLSAYQSIALMAGTNAPEASGGFSMAINNNFGLLPPQTKNLETHASIGFFQDRYLFDIRYYHKTTSGLNNNIPVPTDPSTGLTTQVSYSNIVNRGVEVFFKIKAAEQKNFSYTITLNGAYNANIAKDVPLTQFSATSSYLTAYRNGYSTENLWSYPWAGLAANGSPQIYNGQGLKTTNPDSATLASTLVYSGVIRAPFTGGLIQEWSFKDFFARVSITPSLGHVMREYIPAPSKELDNSILIRDRWRKPGDEAHTDIAALSGNGSNGSVRALIIQNSSNSILPADNIRLQEIQIGWQAPAQLLMRNFFAQELTVSLQVQNIAVWKRNKLHIDPETMANGGEIGLPVPVQYSLSINMRLK
jgi:hypothetical protein